jgi:hypothetical protein
MITPFDAIATGEVRIKGLLDVVLRCAKILGLA